MLNNACKLSHQCYWLFFITLKKSCRLKSFIPTIMTFVYNYHGLLNLRPKANKERILVTEGRQEFTSTCTRPMSVKDKQKSHHSPTATPGVESL